jgi:sugar lactone lactonase YvrE
MHDFLSHISLKLFGILLVGTLVFSTSCHRLLEDLLDDLEDEGFDLELPERIDLTQTGLFPEGIEYDQRRGMFLVSSLTAGTIGLVDDDGNYEPFIEDDRFRSTIGIELDRRRQRVLVPVTQTDGSYGAVGAYDRHSGEPIFYVELMDLTPNHPVFANDIAVDKYGNAYVTNSFNGVIYKVTRGGEASLFFVNEDFVPPAGGFGFNGIEYHPDGFLIVAFSAQNALYKIPLDDPDNYRMISLDAELQNPDGLKFSRDYEELAVVNNAGGSDAGNVLILKSDDDWESAEEDRRFMTGPEFPTTATYRGGEFYVLYAHLDELFGGNATFDDFAIVLVDD